MSRCYGDWLMYSKLFATPNTSLGLANTEPEKLRKVTKCGCATDLGTVRKESWKRKGRSLD